MERSHEGDITCETFSKSKVEDKYAHWGRASRGLLSASAVCLFPAKAIG